MGEWIVGALINLFGSIIINFGTNLLKLGHNERERHLLGSDGLNGKMPPKPIVCFQTWRVGIVFFFLGNCLNFISFEYAAQSLLAALGSVQFVSNIAFAYFILHKMVAVKVLVATAFIVLGNTFLVAFGNHQSPVYTPEQLAEKYTNTGFLLYHQIKQSFMMENQSFLTEKSVKKFIVFSDGKFCRKPFPTENSIGNISNALISDGFNLSAIPSEKQLFRRISIISDGFFPSEIAFFFVVIRVMIYTLIQSTYKLSYIIRKVTRVTK